MPKTLPAIDTLDNLKGAVIVNRYDGGLNATDSNEILADNEAIIRKNWGQSSRGAIEKVNGFTVLNGTTFGAKPIRGLFRVYQSDGTKHILAMCNGKIQYSDDDSSFQQESGSLAVTETVYNTGVNYNNKFFFTNDQENLNHYTPGTTTAAAATDQPTDPCRVLLKRSDRRLLALNNDVNGSTLYYSKVNPTGVAADDWSATNDAGSIAIDGALSEGLVGGMTFGSVDIIFKDYAAFQVWGYPNPVAIRMPGSPGCAAPYSPAQGDGLGFHLAHDGVWMWDGNKFLKISDPIEDIIDGIASAYVRNAFGVYRDGFYWFFYTVSGDTVNKRCVIYDVSMSNPYEGKNVWYERDNLEMNCPVIFNGRGDDNEIYAGGSASTGFVYRLDYASDGTDDTGNIEAIYQTKYFNAGMPYLVKRFPKIYIRYYLNKGDLLFNWYTNRGITSGNFTVPASQMGAKLGEFVLGTDVLASDVEATHVETLPDMAVGKDISIKITHDDSGVAPIIRDIQIEYEGLYYE